MAVMRSLNYKPALKELQRKNSPGVGTYDIQSSSDYVMRKLPRVRIGNSLRVSLDKSVLGTPGPNHYRIDTKSTSPKAVIGTSRREEFNRTINWPGPASYNTFRDLGSSPNYQKVTMSGRNTPASGEKQKSPGPIYNTLQAFQKVKSRNPSFKIGTGAKIMEIVKNRNPGPGSYSFIE